MICVKSPRKTKFWNPLSSIQQKPHLQVPAVNQQWWWQHFGLKTDKITSFYFYINANDKYVACIQIWSVCLNNVWVHSCWIKVGYNISIFRNIFPSLSTQPLASDTGGHCIWERIVTWKLHSSQVLEYVCE